MYRLKHLPANSVTNLGLEEFYVSIALLLMFSLLYIASLNLIKGKIPHKMMSWHCHSMILSF